ncbi:MAG: hypothetical protein DMD41_17040 [Gemmatimonadetes bacterium]|nr:MAG: hypothetical protein DMD41_17040 [Gemmatimonadota bacterium]
MPRAPLPARTQPPTEPRLWLPLAIALAFAGCQDATGPLSERNVARSQVGVAGQLVSDAMASTQLSILQQAPTAPPLETYQLSFWAYKGDPSTVTVNYQPAAGEWVGQPFLELSIPKNGLLAGAGGESLKGGDSVLVTLTIDSVNFSVDFQPSGVVFSTGNPATLVLWYENANPDLNGDGVVDTTDQMLEQQLAVWYHATKTNSWFKLSSNNDPMLPSVSTALYHFCEYAVSW